MENKKNRKVKLFLLGMIVLGVFNFVGIEQGVAQDKKETHITIKKGLNDEFLILSGNGPDVEVYECVEWQCKEMKYWCDPGSVGYNTHYDNGTWCNYDHLNWGDNWQTAKLEYKDDCKAHVIVRIGWAAGSGCFDRREWVGSESYKRSACADNRCVAWKVPADKVLSLMPLIGQAMIDVNLIEY